MKRYFKFFSLMFTLIYFGIFLAVNEIQFSIEI